MCSNPIQSILPDLAHILLQEIVVYLMFYPMSYIIFGSHVH